MIGGGPAGSVAAIAARREGAEVTLYEKSPFPRHKVCGEYLSPEIQPVLESLGVWRDFQASGPAVIERLELHFRKSRKVCKLPEAAFGLSRFRFDDLLLRSARDAGARHVLETGRANGDAATIVAHGRKDASTRGGRIFGFKAHFEGPVSNAIELYFFRDCYAGVNAVENGVTNVCGLATEDLLKRYGFEVDALVGSLGNLSERLGPLRRTMKWLTVGPLVFQNRFHAEPCELQYPAGDALSFVDPFTGSGMLAAVTTGRLAGIAAARRTAVDAYLEECRRRLEKPFRFSALFRNVLASGWAEHLAALVPGRVLVRLTRPRRVV